MTGRSRLRATRAVATAKMTRFLTKKVPRDHRETDEAYRRRRRVVTGVSVVGAGMLGASLSTKPGSTAFYVSTLGVAGTWVVGGFASGPLHRGWSLADDNSLRRPLTTPILTGVGAFGVFYAGALVARKIPVLNTALCNILRFADEGSSPLVLFTTLANGAAEEVFFRGAVYAAVGPSHPVLKTTAVYALATVATRNVALVLAGTVVGTLFALQRRASGGIQAPLLTHLTWATLMLRYMPPLFRRPDDDGCQPELRA